MSGEHPNYGFDVLSEAFQHDPRNRIIGGMLGPSTYLHAGASKVGWPYDQKAEDTFDLPKTTVMPPVDTPDPSEVAAEEALFKNLVDSSSVTKEYSAELTTKGGAQLVITIVSTYRTARPIASFDTFYDAQTAAQALNEHEGY